MAKPIPVTDYKDLSKLYWKAIQDRDKGATNLHPINALDTETRDGNMFLIADSDGRFEDKITLDSVLKFLFSKKFENAWNFFYNIGYDAGVILKLLGKDFTLTNIQKRSILNMIITPLIISHQKD
ncbi:MAG: hypothetical protein ACW9W4_10525 [Candidatus Nitrosopumilus sp. bin_7KS]